MSMKAGKERRHLVIFGRRPHFGVGKRRLAVQIGEAAAWRFQRAALATLSRTLSSDPRWTLWLCLTPDAPIGSGAQGNELSQGNGNELSQGNGNLGARLTRLVRRLPAGPVVVVGSDAPQIERRDIARAFRKITRNQSVFGPCPDGGFWLVGLGRCARQRPPFRNVRWSSTETLSDVVAQIEGQVILLRELEDVDDAASLRRVQAAKSSGRLRRSGS